MLRTASLFSFLLVVGHCQSPKQTCTPIDEAFQRVAENETAVCHCYEDGTFADVDGISIGCSGRSMPAVFAALATLNGTSVGKIRIWDSAMNIVPQDMFTMVRPKTVSIERSSVAIVRSGALTKLGNRLRQLGFKGNMLTQLDGDLVEGLTRLQSLDLSENKLRSLEGDVFKTTPDLRELLLDGNDIAHIDDGVFEPLKLLRKLSLASNQLTNITKNTFRGLESLEVLNLQGNQITSVDWTAFANLKKLKTIDIGTNHITNVELRGLDKLEKLFLNNNSIQSLKSVSLRDLPSLILISMDRNMISEIAEGDLFGLAKSTRLESVTFAANNISHIGLRALAPIQHVSILAIQNNHLTSLSVEGQSVLRPLRRLSTLLVSGNQLKSIKENDLPRTLTHFAADHNQIEIIDGKAFEGMAMQRIYINNNQLQYLPRHTFDSFTPEVLEAVDVSANAWQCVCGEEWLGYWLDKMADRDVSEGVIGCLAKPRCGPDPNTESTEEKSAWVTIFASVLAAVSLLILVIIAVMYVKDGKQKIVIMRPLTRRADSDLHKLLGDMNDGDPIVDETRRNTIKNAASSEKRVRFENN